MSLPSVHATTRDAALQYAADGFHVLPLEPGKKKPLGNLVPHGVKNASCDFSTIEAWWSQCPYANLGIATGAASEAIVIDVDPRNGGDIELKKLLVEHGPFPDTAEVISGGQDAGTHFYFIHPEFKVKNRQIRPGIDCKGDGGYAVAPPSIHPISGKPYLGEIRRPHIAPAPIWFIELLRQGGDLQTRQRIQTQLIASVSSVSSDSSVSSVSEAVLATLPRRVGERNRCLFQFARRLKGMPDFAGKPAETCQWAVQHWHHHALPVIGTKEFEITWAEFVYCWDRVKQPVGFATLLDAFKRAMADLPTRYPEGKLRLLDGLCRELQRMILGGPFFLGCRDAGDLIGTDHNSANILLKKMVRDGALQVVIAGTTSRATRYRYLERNPT
jgi:hypothetical protein